MRAKLKQRFDPLFLRTLTVVILFWALLMAMLTANNYDRMKSNLQHNCEEARRSVQINADLILNQDKPLEEKMGGLLHRVDYSGGFYDFSRGINRLYDAQGNELVRSQLAHAVIALEGTGVYDHTVLFDEVLTEEEQIAMAYVLREDRNELAHFNNYRADAYGEVTGILNGTIIYPKTMAYYYEDRTIALMDSNHPMFDGAELTTLRFDGAIVNSDLVWGYLSPETYLDLYNRANELLDSLVEDRVLSLNSSSVLRAGDGWAEAGHYYDLPDYIMASATVYIPWRMAIWELENTYFYTFAAALLAAIWISRMQKSSMQKERDLTRAMAHEFKTPAAVIRAYAEALREDIAPERREEYLSTLMDEADRMGGMVNELLELSRLNGAQTAQVREEVALKPLVENCFERLRLPMEERGLNLELNLLPAFCQGDPKRLERAISNLALNALHHADPGPVQVMLGADGLLVVENRCPPIPEEVLSRLWEPFYKGDDSRGGEGSGLGLAIVKNIVQLHGGTCRVELTNNGICFLIRFN